MVLGKHPLWRNHGFSLSKAHALKEVLSEEVSDFSKVFF